MSSALFKALGRTSAKRKQRARKLAPKMPDGERLLYSAKLNAFWSAWGKHVYQELAIQRVDAARVDSIKTVLTAAYLKLLQNSGLDALLGEIGERVAGKAIKYMKNVVRIPATIKGKEVAIDAFRHRNLALIKDLGSDHLAALDKLLSGASAVGQRHEELALAVKDLLGVGESRAELIARDQVLKLNSNMHQLAQTGAGVTSYIWSTSGDERVRDSHAELDGEEQDWSDPPVVDGERVHPGEAIQCRCAAVPIVPLFEGV
jgi:SPP1 gp7 family putative phage head morphogenesis protein